MVGDNLDWSISISISGLLSLCIFCSCSSPGVRQGIDLQVLISNANITSVCVSWSHLGWSFPHAGLCLYISCPTVKSAIAAQFSFLHVTAHWWGASVSLPGLQTCPPVLCSWQEMHPVDCCATLHTDPWLSWERGGKLTDFFKLLMCFQAKLKQLWEFCEKKYNIGLMFFSKA